jgi:putative peptidoglycan lipid II flippase
MPTPESDPYAVDSAADLRPRRGVQPGVPGWSMGQDSYTSPIYDDTGWHIDLSGVDWAGKPAEYDDGPSGQAPTFQYENGNVADPGWSADEPPVESWADGTRYAAPAPPRVRRPGRTPLPPGWTERPARGRHSRPAAMPRPAERPGVEPAGDAQPAPQPPQDEQWTADPAPRVRPRPIPRRPVVPRPAGPRAPGAARPRGAESVSVVKSSGVMAAGTLASRLTGFLRTIVQSAALGAAGIATAYNLSNTLPNVVYNLALGGILTSVIVPLIVNAGKRDADRGAGYDQRMFTLITLALAGITVVATAAAVPIVAIYSGSQVTGPTRHVAVILALFFIPQIFFYGVSSLIGAILNSRGSFAAPMWTPIVNNFVVIAVLALYIVLVGPDKLAYLDKHPGMIPGSDIALLGIGTTLGIVAQTVALMPALRRVGFRWQPRLDFRRAEVREIGRMGGWMFGYIAATQVAFLITTKLAGDTSSGVTTYNYAWLLFQLPYAVVGISVITALLPRMSAHAADRRFGLVRSDFSMGVRLAATIVVPCSLVLAVLGPKLGLLFFGHGATTAAQASYEGAVFAVFCLGLLPYMIFQLQLRVFYSVHDSKTPALIGLVTMTVNIVANIIALTVLPKSVLVAGLGAGFGLANLAGAFLAWRILTRRLHGLDGWRIGRSLVRMHAATLPAALLVVIVVIITGDAVADVIIGGLLGTAMYFLFARALRIDELTDLTKTVMSRVGR